MLNYMLCVMFVRCCVDRKVGGTEEYDICDAIKSGLVTKPVVVWCIGTCAGMFTSEVSKLSPFVLRYFLPWGLLTKAVRLTLPLSSQACSVFVQLVSQTDQTVLDEQINN